VVAGVHWPLDILAGAAAGFLGFFMAKYLLAYLKA
jgi:membrane-associated phospholipid phosphatase